MKRKLNEKAVIIIKRTVSTTAGVLLLSGIMLSVNAMGVSQYSDKLVENEILVSDIQNSTEIQLLANINSIEDLSIDPQVKITSKEDLNSYFESVMTNEEIEMIYDFIDNNHNEASLSSRDMTESEHNRTFILRDEYEYDGVRPENPLAILNPESEFYYDSKSDTYNYPDRELTDEEILQHIDWGFRINYALGLRIPDDYMAAKPSAKDISEEEAIKNATKAVEQVYDVDVSHLHCYAMYFNDAAQTSESIWMVQFSPLKSRTLMANNEVFWNYFVNINSLTGEIIEISGNRQPSNTSKINENNKDSIYNDPRWLEVSEEYVNKFIDNSLEIKDIYIDKEYENRFASTSGINEEVKESLTMRYLEIGSVEVIVVLEDDAEYRVVLNYPDYSLKSISVK